MKIALREKGLAFRAVLPEEFGSGRTDGDLGRANPRREVPVLIDHDVELFDSTIILEYLEERWAAPPLLPDTPAARARARLVEEICDTHYEAVNWGFGEVLWFRRATGELASRLRAEAARHTAILQDWLTTRLNGAAWFGGDDFGWADAAAAPMVNRSVHYELGPAAGTPLGRWHDRLLTRPAVAETFREFDAAAARMATAADHYTTGGRRREYRDHRIEWLVKAGGIDVVLRGLAADNIRFSWPD